MKSVEKLADSARALLLKNQSLDAGIAIDELLDSSYLERNSDLAQTGEVPDEHLRNELLSRLSGTGPLQVLLDDDEIEEIWINRPNEVFYVKQAKSFRQQCELSAELLRTICLNLLRSSGRRIDRVAPFVDAALPDGSRLHIVIPDITSAHWAVNIRKFPSKQLLLADLVANETVTQAQAGQLREAVTAGKNILISGSTQTGKTTLLSALLAELKPQTRLITCEETFEIKSPLVDWVALQTRQPNLEGEGSVTLRRLVKEALRMRPDRLVVGEVREAESFDMLIAMNSGIPGMCTIHANSATNALSKLKALPMLAAPNISAEFIAALIEQCIDIVVHLTTDTGKRRVHQILEVQS